MYQIYVIKHDIIVVKNDQPKLISRPTSRINVNKLCVVYAEEFWQT
jgi:hypothetical protein